MLQTLIIISLIVIADAVMTSPCPSRSITPLSCHDIDLGSQKCHVGPRLLQTCNAKLHSPAKVTIQGHTYICRLWPRVDGSEQFLSIDTSVCQTVNPGRLSSCASTVNGDDIQVIDDVATLEVIEVDVVFADSSRVHKVRHSSCLRAQLCENISSMLRSLIVAPGYVVDCTRLSVGALLGLTHVMITQTQPDCECGELVPSSCLVIRNITSAERFQQQGKVCRLGGLGRQLRQLQEIFEQSFIHSKQLRNLGISPIKGVLLRGPTGCGKTSLMLAAAARCDAFLIPVNASEIVGSRTGESEANLEELFEKGRQMSLDCPVVIFFDDIDTLCAKQSREHSQQNCRIVSHMAKLMAKLQSSENVVVVAATNRPSAMDPTLRGAGKLEKEVSAFFFITTKFTTTLVINQDPVSQTHSPQVLSCLK